MNCANHPDVPVAAYCQNCGKGLCSSCVRSVGGVIYCEQCLAARLGMGARPAAAGVPPVGGVVAPGGPNPAAAFALGFIPGVGAMYNGQFIKGLVHVLIFIILIGITEHAGVFGIAIAGWIAYQVFDAYETAKARRDGRPLPDPFGLNDFGAKMGIPMGPGVGGPGVAQGFTGGQVPPPPPPGAEYPPPPPAGYADPHASYPGVPPNVPPEWVWGRGRGRREPIGAIILIGLGVLFLLNSLDIFHFDWFGRLWPLLIIGFGVALFIRRSREVPPPPPPPPSGGAQ